MGTSIFGCILHMQYNYDYSICFRTPYCCGLISMIFCSTAKREPERVLYRQLLLAALLLNLPMAQCGASAWGGTVVVWIITMSEEFSVYQRIKRSYEH